MFNSQDILSFWFSPETEPKWFVKDPTFDESIRELFGLIYEEMLAESNKPLINEISKATDALAGVIILDQFPRNMFRDTPQAFATDPMAISLAKAAIVKGLDQHLTPIQRNFLYMPFMHSESLADQEEGVRLFSSQPSNDYTVAYAIQHRDIIKEFGRFPHRNAVLGRKSTPEELKFLTDHPGF